MNKLTISVVNYNTGDYLSKCLLSIERVRDEAAIDVYIVDNASIDDSFERARKKYPKNHYIKNEVNLGFGKAHNQVLKINKNEFILILNPDSEIKKGDLKTMLSIMESDVRIGAASPEIILSNGEVDLTAHRGFPTPWASFRYYILGDDSLYHLTQKDMHVTHEVDAITGAFFLTRKSVLEKVGYFDEDYFMYAEDIDLCFRIKKAGYKVVYVPEIKVLHYKGISTGLKKHSQHQTSATVETRKKMTDYFYHTMKIFYKKHYEKKYPFFINWMVNLAINFKWLLAKRKLTV